MNPILSVQAFVLGTKEHISSQPQAVIEFHLAPQWHIYWENYGDTGMSTSVDDGILMYPTPQQIPLPGALMSYGYKGRVVFFVKNPKKRVVVRWLACKDDTCIPGKKEMLLQQAQPDQFQKDWEALPKDCPFTWEHRSDILSRVEAKSNSWMAPFSDLAGSVQIQYEEKGAHYVQWNTTTPKGKYLWTSDTLSCVVHI